MEKVRFSSKEYKNAAKEKEETIAKIEKEMKELFNLERILPVHIALYASLEKRWITLTKWK